MRPEDEVLVVAVRADERVEPFHRVEEAREVAADAARRVGRARARVALDLGLGRIALPGLSRRPLSCGLELSDDLFLTKAGYWKVT